MPESALTADGPVTTGLIGLPIAHRLSPALHHAAFRAYGLPDQYALWPTEAEQLPARVAALRQPSMRGANVTIPHKSAALALVDALDPVAQAIGAVNTIVRQADGSLLGLNTDSAGFVAALQQADFDPSGRNIVLLGAGGAARAVAHGLIAHGARCLTVVNRTAEHAEALLADLLAATPYDPDLFVLAPDDPDLPDLLRAANLLVNATPVGSDDRSLPLPPTMLHAQLLVCDLLYRSTPLLRSAQAAGAHTQDGLEMLVQQAALAFTAWTGYAAPVDVMRAAGEQARATAHS